MLASSQEPRRLAPLHGPRSPTMAKPRPRRVTCLLPRGCKPRRPLTTRQLAKALPQQPLSQRRPLRALGTAASGIVAEAAPTTMAAPSILAAPAAVVAATVGFAPGTQEAAAQAVVAAAVAAVSAKTRPDSAPGDAAARAAWDKVDALLKQSAEGQLEAPKGTLDAESIDFLNECDEAVQRVCDGLMKVEKGEPSDAKLVDAVYRDVHSIKGGAQLFNMPNLASVTHALENVLDYIRRQKRPFEAREVDPILNLMTTVAQWVTNMREGAKAVAPAAVGSAKPKASSVPADNTAGVPRNAAVGTAAEAKAASEGADSSVRVPVALLDKLMASMGEMVLVRNQVLQFANRSDDFEFLRMSQRLDIVTSEIQGEVMKTRMQPIGVVLTKFQRIVRDLSNSLNKRIDLILAGTETELDKTLLEAVKDPLMHIVRNSCDHGLEPVEERRAAGKTDAGKILIKSFQEGGQVVIEVSDDGRGLNREKLLKKAVEKGLVTADRGFAMSNRDVYYLIFAAGFSTAAEVTNVSGRGVGMDVVKSNIEKIGGLVELESRLNLGMTIRLKIPLTLAILPAMIIRSDNELYAIPQVKVVELVRIEPSDGAAERIDMLQGKPIYRLRGTLLPLLSIKEILGLPYEDPKQLLAQALPLNIVVVRAEKQMFGIIVDEVQEKADIVIKPLSSFLKSVSAYGGATVLGDGAIALILDIAGVAQLHNLGLGENSYAESSEELERARRARLEAQEFLLFRVAERNERHAIPMSLVHRLEERNEADIEHSGNQNVVRYRDGVLPILSLGKRLGYDATEGNDGGIFRLVVVKKSNRLFGFRVSEILDVLATLDQMDEAPTDSPLLLGNLVTKDGVVVVVDVLRVIEEYVKTLAAPPAQLDFSEKDGRIRLLFAEDTTFFRKHVKSVLEKAGFRIDLAINGVEAVDMLKRGTRGDVQGSVVGYRDAGDGRAHTRAHAAGDAGHRNHSSGGAHHALFARKYRRGQGRRLQ